VTIRVRLPARASRTVGVRVDGRLTSARVGDGFVTWRMRVLTAARRRLDHPPLTRPPGAPHPQPTTTGLPALSMTTGPSALQAFLHLQVVRDKRARVWYGNKRREQCITVPSQPILSWKLPGRCMRRGRAERGMNL